MAQAALRYGNHFSMKDKCAQDATLKKTDIYARMKPAVGAAQSLIDKETTV